MAAATDDFDGAMLDIVSNYDKCMTLRPKQRDVFERIWNGQRDMIVSLPTGYGKSVIFHLIGRLLRKRGNVGDVTLVVCPLNLIQKDQLESLREHNISACKLDITGKGSYLVEEEEEEDEGDDFNFDKVSKPILVDLDLLVD